jgi:hypothetical protein
MAGIHRVGPVWLLAAAVVLSAACSGRAPAPAVSGATTHYNSETRRLERVTYDRNSDGRIDATTFMNGAVVTHAELDENFDGTVDRREYFVARPNREGATPAATVLERVEVSSRTDGRVTRWERYDLGVLRDVEEDADEDGRVDKWETWADGSLAAIALDTNGDGRPDRRLVYPPGGGEPRIEIDRDGTGAFAREASAHTNR